MIKIIGIVLGVLALAVGCLIFIVLVDDCLYWADDTIEKGDDDRDNP